MSKNFELLRSLDKKPDISRTEPMTGEMSAAVVAQPTPVRRGTRVPGSALARLDDGMRNEISKIMQHILALKNGGPTRVVFAGVDEDAGCSLICAATAEMLAQEALGTVCLVDANLRSPSLHAQFGLEMAKGVLDVMLNETPSERLAHPVGSSGLRLVMAGSCEPQTNVLQSSGVSRIIAGLSEKFDYVLIHSPNVNHYTDVFTVGRLSDGVVVVIEANTTRRETARRVSESLKSAGVAVLGAVLNNRTYPIPNAIYKLL